MIISCPKCNKRFNIDESLIPNGGRLLQCSNCMNKWHFKIKKNEDVIKESLQTKKVIIENKKKEKKINPSQEFTSFKDKAIEKELKKDQKVINKEKKKNKKEKKKTNQ